MTEDDFLALIIEAGMLVVAICVSVASGMLVAPWLGFLVFAAFVLAFVAMTAVAYKRAHPKDES